MSNVVTKFFQSSLSIVAHVFNLLTNRVDSTALALKEKAENEINIPVLYEEYHKKTNEKLDYHANSLTSLRAEITKNKNQLRDDEALLQKTAIQINKAEDNLKTVNVDELDMSDKYRHEYSLKTMRLEAKILMGDISTTRAIIQDQEIVADQMMKDYHENRFMAKKVLGELKSLQNRDTLLKTKQSIETIELGTTNFKIADIKRIVEGKEAWYEAKQYTDTVLLRGDKSTADSYIEYNNSEQEDSALDNLLLSVRNGQKVENIVNKSIEVKEEVFVNEKTVN